MKKAEWKEVKEERDEYRRKDGTDIDPEDSRLGFEFC